MKNLLLLFASITFTFSSVFAQPDIKYKLHPINKKCHKLVSPLTFQNIVITESNSAFAISNYWVGNQMDFYLSKINKDFDTLWARKFGGSGEDLMENILQLKNGNLFIAGTTQSKDGDVWYGHTYSAKEIWCMEVDTFGNIIKGKCFGGGNGSDLDDAVISKDGSIYLCGSTIAHDYDFTHYQYSFLDSDGWVAKLDTSFNIKWVRFYGGNMDEGTATLKEMTPNNIIFATETSSTDTLMLGNQAKGDADAFIGMLDSNGNLKWKKRFGSFSIESIYLSALDTTRKVIYFVGKASIAAGDIWYATPGGDDAWIFKLDTLGNILQSKSYGPTILPQLLLQDALFYDNHLWVTAGLESGSGGGDADANINNLDNAWVAMIDTNANLVGQYTFNGNMVDALLGNIVLWDESLYFVGASFGYLPNSETCSPNTDSTTVFVVNMQVEPLFVSELEEENNFFTLIPNPSSTTFRVEFNSSNNNELKVLDILGQVIYKKTVHSNNIKIDCSTWRAGEYVVVVQNGNTTRSKKFLKN